MNPRELKKAIRNKAVEFELALAAERPYAHLKNLSAVKRTEISVIKG
jgi:hypothetical protein